MKLIGRTLAVLAAALVVVGFWMAVGTLTGSSGTVMAGEMGGHAMASGFNAAGVVEILPSLAAVAIVTAIVAPIKRRLLSARRPAARAPKAATPAA